LMFLRASTRAPFPGKRCFTSSSLGLVAERNDPRWAFLRDDTLLSQRVGEFIELPDLPGHKPKLLKSKDWQNFLLTEQRLEIAKEVIGAIGQGPLKETRDNGLCLSGPQGVGKSALNYLLASIAYVRGWRLQYIPLCGEWAELETDELRADYFNLQYKCLNDNLPAPKQRLRQGRKISNTKKKRLQQVNTQVSLQANLLKDLRDTTDKPVLIILDEHNELYRWRELVVVPPPPQTPDLKRYQYKSLAYFSRFTKWTSLTGPRLYTIYSGSAHSEFEDNLPSGEQTKLRFLRPFDEPEAVKLIEELRIPEKVGRTASAIYDLVTGGLPRHISLLAVDEPKSLTAWASAMVLALLRAVQMTSSQLDPDNKKNFVAFIGARLTGQSFPYHSSIWYDKGFLYKTSFEDPPQIINPIARASLWEYYVQSILPVVNEEGETGSVIGTKLEVAISVGLAKATRTIHPFEIGGQGSLTPWVLPKVDRILRFSKSTLAPDRNPVISDKCWLWIPSIETHASFDFILQDFENKQVIFIQVSKQIPQRHKDKGNLKVLKAFMPGDQRKNEVDKRPLIEIELEMVTKEQGWTAEFQGGIISATKKGSTQWTVKFLFITSGSENEVKKNTNYEVKNMAIVGKEQLSSLGVFWRDVLL